MAQPYSQPREVHLKLVFFGPASAGKTSALNYLYRVLRSDGTIAEHLYDEQRQRLLSEGVLFTGHKVRMSEYRWDGKPVRRRAR